MRRFLKNNGLSVALFGLFLLSFVGHALSGWRHDVEQQEEHGAPAPGFVEYLRSGDFLESVFENWESEFLQMAAFLVLSAALVQRGSAESKPPKDEPEEPDPRETVRPESPWPVHRGGWALRFYNHSLSIALVGLFLLSFALHAVTGLQKYNEEAALHAQPKLTLAGYVGSSTFWFESFQNWQSEFLSVGMIVVLSIFLRQTGSPQSKPVQAPHSETG
jgi:hypothetical protein